MKEETITKYIDQLAQSLNVASEHVYEALIKQAMVTGIIATVWAVIMSAVVLGCLNVIQKTRKKAQESGDYFDESEAFLKSMLFGLIIFASFVSGYYALETALTALLNPEYWAIKEVLNAINS